MTTCCLLAAVLAHAPVGPLAKRSPAPLPWHLADFYVELEQDVSFESASVDVAILDDMPDKPRLFFCPLAGQLDGRDFYCGLMTLVPHARQQNSIGGILHSEIARGSAFTRWGDMLVASVRPGQSGWYAVSDHEGIIASVKHIHSWKKGVYTVRVTRMDADEAGGKAYRWAGAFITDHATGFTHYLGALRFPGLEPKLDHVLAGFVEVYGSPVLPPPSPDTLPPVRLVFGNWRVNNAPVIPKQVKIVYPAAVPQHASAIPADAFWATCGEKPPQGAPVGKGAFAVYVGPKKYDRKQFEEVLFTAPGK